MAITTEVIFKKIEFVGQFYHLQILLEKQTFNDSELLFRENIRLPVLAPDTTINDLQEPLLLDRLKGKLTALTKIIWSQTVKDAWQAKKNETMNRMNP